MSTTATRGGSVGDWYAHCDVCGRRFFGSTMRMRYDSLFVCDQDWEERHPQEIIKAVTENRNVPISRPEPAETAEALNDPITNNNADNWYGNGSID